MQLTFRSSWLLASLLVACSSSGSGGGGPSTNTGLTCTSANQCYSGLDAGALKGSLVCLPLQGGYCSHTCTVDADCCAVPGECAAGIKEICSPLESNPQTYCVLSCETADMPAGSDANVFCQNNANPNFNCRSTGGGAKNRKFCGP
jgi:hypothetical protein